jgi:hypothetical protein
MRNFFNPNPNPIHMHTGLSCILVARFFDSQGKLNIEQGVLKTGGIYERILRHRANKAGRFSK